MKVKLVILISLAAILMMFGTLIFAEGPENQEKVCRVWWMKVAESDLNNFATQINRHEWIFQKPCFEFEKKFINPTVVDKIKSCDADQWKNLDCLGYLPFYRASVVDYVYSPKDESRYTSLSSEVLKNIIIARTTVGRVDGDQLTKVADILISRQPANFDFKKLRATLVFLRFMKSKKTSDGDELLSNIAAAKKFQKGNDYDLLNLELLYFSKVQDFSNFNKEIDSYLEKNPRDSRAQYWKAEYFWQQKQDRKSTLERLETAKNLSPKNDLIKTTLKKAKTAKLGEAIFSMNMSFDMMK